MATPQELLIAGYVRDVQNILHNRIIPISFNKIVYEYYFAELLLIYIVKDLSKPWYIADIETKGEKIWQSVVQDNTRAATAGFTKPCIGYNLQLPSHLIGDDSKLANKRYNGIFTCGGYLRGKSKLCSVTLFDSKDPQTLSTEHDPDLEFATWGNSCIYSDKYGLLSVGGQSVGNTVWNLKLNENEDDYKWKMFPEKMINEHYYPAVTMIDNGSGYNDKLFVGAGFKTKSVVSKAMDTKIELYDLEKGEWTELAQCKIKRSICGIFYDRLKQNVYLAGSKSGLSVRAPKTVEYYDIEKNVWHLLPECNFMHEWYPLIWKNPNGILYVASVSSNGLEYIDLRDKYNQWIVECGQAKGKFKPILKPKLEARFGTEFNNAPQESWLLPLM